MMSDLLLSIMSAHIVVYDGVSFERHKLAKKEAKKAVQNARAKVYKKVWEIGHQRGWKGYI